MAIYEDLEGATVLITGGAQGIGEAMVKAFLDQKAEVFFCDIDSNRGIKLASQTGANFQRLDLREEMPIVNWIKDVVKSRGTIDVLINNAACDPRIKLCDQSVAAWDSLMALNLRSQMITAREASPHMPEGSSIINFSSLTFTLGAAPMTAYVSSKAAILGFTRSLGRELGPKRIRVNAISPGWIMTERQLQDFVTDEVKHNLTTRLQSIPDLLVPENIAEVALFLASRVSNAITGQEILADHGWVHS